MILDEIELARINLVDERFRTSYPGSNEILIKSIKVVGLLTPPIVTLRGDRTVLVTGWKRISACLEIGLARIPVLRWESPDDLSTFKAGVYDNLSTREFGVMEKAEILSRMVRFGEDSGTILSHFLPLLNIPPTRDHLDSYLGFSDLDQRTKEMIHGKNLPFPVVSRLIEFSTDERDLLNDLLVPLGRNKQLELLDNLIAVTKKEGISLVSLLGREEFRSIRISEKLTDLQKAEQTRKRLDEVRYPRLTSWKKKFKGTLNSVQWPERVAISPSQNYEDDEISIGFQAKDVQELRRRLKELWDVASREDISLLFEQPEDD